MAGGFGSKQNPKNNPFGKSGLNNNEILKSSSQFSQEKPHKISFGGILTLGQSIEINHPNTPDYSWKKEFLNVNYLQKEQEVIVKQQQQELQKAINELRVEIQKLIQSTENLDTEIEQIAIQPIVENNEYQLTVLQRVKRLVINFTRNISQAGIWCESFSRKKQKRNAFWNNVKNKKNGGEQYLFSSEHSAARSTN